MSASLDQRPLIGDDPVARQTGPSCSVNSYREALSMWLAWNRAYEQLTARMFDSRHDPAALQELMDQADELRRRAIERSEGLLSG
jgi:hypothetical protein